MGIGVTRPLGSDPEPDCPAGWYGSPPWGWAWAAGRQRGPSVHLGWPGAIPCPPSSPGGSLVLPSSPGRTEH